MVDDAQLLALAARANLAAPPQESQGGEDNQKRPQHAQLRHPCAVDADDILRIGDQKLELIEMRRHGAILVGDAGDAHDVADGEPGKTAAVVGPTGEKYLQRVVVVAHAQIGAAEVRAQFDDRALGNHQLPEAPQILDIARVQSDSQRRRAARNRGDCGNHHYGQSGPLGDAAARFDPIAGSERVEHGAAAFEHQAVLSLLNGHVEVIGNAHRFDRDLAGYHDHAILVERREIRRLTGGGVFERDRWLPHRGKADKPGQSHGSRRA